MAWWKRTKLVYLLLAATLGVGALAIGVSGRASAAADSAAIVSAGSPVTSRGNLTLELTSTAPVTAVTAHLLADSGTGGDVFDVPLVSSGVPDASNPELSDWSVAAPITPSQLALGSYAVTADVTFGDASTVTAYGSEAVLQFLDEPVITLTADHTKVGYDYSPTVNLTGSVQILAPDGTESPDPAATVQLAGTGGYSLPVTSATTDDSGSFTAQATMTGSGSIQAKVVGTGTLDTQQAAVTFTQVIDTVKLAAKLSAATVMYGTPATVTGSLSYLPGNTGSTYKALAGHQVRVFNSAHPTTVAASAATNANGQFSIKLPSANVLGSTWTVAAGASAGDSLFGTAQVELPMKVQVPVAVSGLSVTLSQYGQLSYSGCLNPAKPIPGAKITSTANLVFQYSAAGPNGPWKNTLWKPPVKRTCGNGGVYFSVSTKAPTNYAYYRMRYYGTTSAGTVYLPAISPSKLVWKYKDRIVNFATGPAYVYSRTGKTTISGHLQYYANSAWHNYAGQVVSIIYQVNASAPWRAFAAVKTNSTGYFSATVKAPQKGYTTWSAQFNGNSTHLSARPSAAFAMYYAG